MPGKSAEPMPGRDLVRRCLTCLLALPLVGLCVAASARAQPTLITDSYQLAGERSELGLAGDATLVGSPDGETTNLIRSFAPGRAPQVIARAKLLAGERRIRRLDVLRRLCHEVCDARSGIELRL